MPTPNLFRGDVPYTTPNIEQSPEDPGLEILYVTDRANGTPVDAIANYNNERSSAVSFGVAEIPLSPGVDWTTLAAASTGGSRVSPVRYGNVVAKEAGRFPETPYLFSVANGEVEFDPAVLEELNESKEGLRKLITAKLETAETNDVVLFVHGFNNSFNYAAETLGGIWHFLQRRHVPILYSWPSGSGGIRGYFVDRISGEFTIFHLKETLRTLFETPEIDNIHIIAHSRGTDVITTALRELVIEYRGQAKNPQKEFGIANLILAAPDLDYGVIRQRLMAEAFGPAFEKITVYTTTTDKALTVSQLLMKGIRFGLLSNDNIDKRDSSILRNVGNVSFVQAQNIKTLTGHDYFISNPGVSSDMLTVINHRAIPGTPLRPLVHKDGNFWELPDNYPLVE